MNELQIFKNAEFGSVCTLTIENEPYFVGKDVAEILGYINASKAVLTHVDNEDKSFVMLDISDSQNGNVPTGQTKTAVINERSLYSLILSSKLPTAKKFKRWVTSEVLPAIGKHGVYAVDELLSDPDTLIAALTQLKAEREKGKGVYGNGCCPKVADHGDETEGGLLRCCAELQGSCGNFGDRQELRLLYQKYAEKGYASTKTHSYPANDGTVHTKVHTLATALMEQQTPVQEIAEILGHQSTESTPTYLKSSLSLLRECALSLEVE